MSDCRYYSVMRHQYLILTGIPASGKSTIARALSEELGLEIFDKDEILEDLFNEKGVGDVHWRTTLSRTAEEILQERASRSESSIICVLVASSGFNHGLRNTNRMAIRLTR